MFCRICNNSISERAKGSAALPLAIPAAPRRNRCFALRSPANSSLRHGETRRYSSHPWDSPFGPTQALFNIAPGNFVVSRFASVRHPWWPDLVFPSPAHRFQAGTHRFQQLRFLLLAKRLQRHGWRLNRRSVAWRPGQPTGMWAEGAALQGCYLAPDPKAARHKLRAPRSGDPAARARGCRGRRRLAAPCVLLAPFGL